MGGACSVHGGGRGIYRVLVGKPEGKRPLGRSRHRWEDNIKMELQEVGCGGMDWIKLAQDREKWQALVNMVMNFGFHKMWGISWLAENRLPSQEVVTRTSVATLCVSIDNMALYSRHMGKGRRGKRDKICKPKYSNNIYSTKAMVSHLKKTVICMLFWISSIKIISMQQT